MARPFEVRYIGFRGARVDVDISDHVVSLDKWVDEGSGNVASARVMLRANDGEFLTDTHGGTTPIIDQYAELLVTVGYPDETRRSRVFYVNRYEPQRGRRGTQVSVELFGREAYLQRHYAAGHYYFTPWSRVIERLCVNFFTPGSRQPIIVCDVTAVPDHAVGTINFGDGTASSYDAVMRVLGLLNQGTSAGGAGDLFTLTFSDPPYSAGLTSANGNPPDYNTLQLTVRSQGSRNAALASPDTRRVVTAGTGEFIECQQTHEPEDANTVIVRGQQDFGTLPREFAIWRSAIETYDNYPEWDDGTTYREGARVRHAGRVWRRLAHGTDPITPGTNVASWVRYNFYELVGDTATAPFNYSPWTHGRAREWRNMASRPDLPGSPEVASTASTSRMATDYDSPAYPDCNLQIRDDAFARDWATFGPVNSIRDIPISYRSNSLRASSLPVGSRVLCGPTFSIIHSGDTSASTTDKYGNSFANALATVTEGNELVVIRSVAATQGFGAIRLKQGDQCAVLSTGRLHEWQYSFTTDPSAAGLRSRRGTRRGTTGSTVLAWRDISATALGSDCFHRPTTIENVQGFLRGRERSGGDDFSVNSAVRITYELSTTVGLLAAFTALTGPLAQIYTALDGLTDASPTADFSLGAYGWWAVLYTAPMPPSSQGTATRGSLYKPDEFDANNLNTTPTGLKGLYAADGIDLGETSGCGVFLNWEESLGDTLVPFQGNFPFRYVVYDGLGNVWSREITYRIQRETEDMATFWSEFRIWRARAPWGLTNALLNTITPERLELERLDPRRIKMIILQFDRPYDEFGRFTPWADWGVYLKAILSAGQPIRHRGTLDGFRFFKPAMARAQSADSGRRTISGPVVEHEGVSNHQQLENIAGGELAVARHRLRSYTIRLAGTTDIQLDDTIYYRDPLTVPESDNGASTKRLVVTRVMHAAPEGGAWTTEVEAVDRIGDA